MTAEILVILLFILWIGTLALWTLNRAQLLRTIADLVEYINAEDIRIDQLETQLRVYQLADPRWKPLDF